MFRVECDYVFSDSWEDVVTVSIPRAYARLISVTDPREYFYSRVLTDEEMAALEEGLTAVSEGSFEE